MTDVEGILQVCREASGVDWQAHPRGSEVSGDPDTFIIGPVQRPDEIWDYVLLLVLDDPEEGKLAPSLRAFTMEEWLDFRAIGEEHTDAS